jgi:5-methylcytosine-specific restriction endonuclease McrA
MPDHHSGRPYRRLQRGAYANRPPYCLRCGGFIDMRLREIDPNHNYAPSLDHRIPIARGGDKLAQDNAWVSHRRCNTAYRDGRSLRPVTTQRETKRVSYGASRAW